MEKKRKLYPAFRVSGFGFRVSVLNLGLLSVGFSDSTTQDHSGRYSKSKLGAMFLKRLKLLFNPRKLVGAQ